MEYMPLGRTGKKISPIGLGCVTFGREIDQDASFRLLDYAVEKGITLLDTAESYGGGQARARRLKVCGTDDVREASGEMSSSEKIIGRWLRSRNCRDEVTVCTKVRTKGGGGTAESISAALAGSLERLCTDYVDIFLMHTPDLEVPIARTLDELTANVKAGRIRTIGASNYSATQLREALETAATGGYSRFEAVQPPYSLVAREAEDELFDLCLREGVAVTAYSPLAAGFLSGKYGPDRNSILKGSRFDIAPGHGDAYFTDRSFRIMEKLRKTAKDMGLPPVRLAMAWVMSHPAVTCTLIGARTEQHIDNALSSFEMNLDPALWAEMVSWT